MFSSAYHRVNALLLVLLVLLALAIIAILATKAGAGSLDPPGPPASTMKSLNDVPALGTATWTRRTAPPRAPSRRRQAAIRIASSAC